MSQPEHVAEVVALEPRRAALRAGVEALRPRQWVKNLLVLAGIVFAAELDDPGRWLAAVVALAVYCAASSAAYLVNDVHDATADRLHPAKCRRPVARGALAPRAALALAGYLLAFALALGTLLGPVSLVCLLGFVLLQAAYTMRLKQVVILDATAIALLFVLRAVAGALAVDVPISRWLLLCTWLLALFLALCKRRAELVGSAPIAGRTVLSSYSLGRVDQVIAVVAASTIVAYAVYTVTAHTSHGLAATIPLVVYGLGRYLLLLRRGGVGEEPENVLLSDGPILATVVAWASLCALLIALG